MVIEYDKSMGSLRELIKNHSFVLIDFCASCCGPCKMLSPIVDKVSQEFSNLTVIKVNIDTDVDTATEFSIMSVPYLHLYKDGEIIAKNNGSMNAASLTNFIQKNT